MNWKQKRILEFIEEVEKAQKKLAKARAERIWIENNPQINIVTYPFYKIKRIMSQKD